MKNSAYRFIFTALVSSSPSFPLPPAAAPAARSLSLSRLAPRISVSFRARSSFSLCRFLAPPLVRASTRASLPSNNRSLCSIARHTRLPCPFACLLVRRSRFSDAVSALRLFSFFSPPTADLRSVLDTRARARARKIAEQRANSMTVE